MFFFFFLIFPLGREGKSLAGSSKPAYVTSIQSYHRSNKAIKRAWLASFFCCLRPFVGEGRGIPPLGLSPACSSCWLPQHSAPKAPPETRGVALGQERAVFLLPAARGGGRGARGGRTRCRGAAAPLYMRGWPFGGVLLSHLLSCGSHPASNHRVPVSCWRERWGHRRHLCAPPSCSGGCPSRPPLVGSTRGTKPGLEGTERAPRPSL